MAPCIDLYVLVPHANASTLQQFVDRYVDLVAVNPWRAPFASFDRAYLQGAPGPGDLDALREVARGDLNEDALAFSLYFPAKDPQVENAIITITVEGHAVLGLRTDCKDNSEEEAQRARTYLKILRASTGASLALGDVEFPPPQTMREWHELQQSSRNVSDEWRLIDPEP